MKFIQSMMLAAVVSTPVYAVAQQNQSMTRQQVRAELIELQRVGYNPASDHTQYPTNIQAASARLHSREHGFEGSYGPAVSGTVASGFAAGHATASDFNPLYDRP